MRQGSTWTKIGTGFLIAALTAITVGCSGGNNQDQTEPGSDSSTEPKNGGTITIAIAEEPDTLDTHKTLSGIAYSIIATYFGSSLLYKDPETKLLHPSLAESYTISDDKKSWTFKLRSGVTFQDGTPLTAKRYKETFDRMLQPEHLSSVSASEFDGLSGAEAPDDQTLVLHFDSPAAPILTNLSYAAFAQPMPIDVIEKIGSEYGRKPIGVGPFKVTGWKTGESVTLEKNTAFTWGEGSYKNQGAPHLDGLVFRFIKDAQTVKAALESGSVDIAYQLNGKVAKSFRNNPKYEVLEDLNLGVTFLGMNLQDKRFTDPAVRRAISYAINKEAIVQSALQGEGIVAHSPLAKSIFGYDPSSESYDYKYNIEEAKKLLDAAGWIVNGEGVREKDGEKLTVNLIHDETKRLEAQLIQTMLAQVGIQVKTQQLEGAAYYDASNTKAFDILLRRYEYTDPDILYYLFHTTQSGNKYSIDDAKLNDLLVDGRITFDPKARLPIYKEVQKLIVEQAYVVPLYTQKDFTVINSKVKGVKYSDSVLLLNDAWVNQ